MPLVVSVAWSVGVVGRVLGDGVEFHCISEAQQICPSRCYGVTGSHLVLVECGEWEAQVLVRWSLG